MEFWGKRFVYIIYKSRKSRSGNFVSWFTAHATGLLCSSAANNRLSWWFTFFKFFFNKYVIRKLYDILLLPGSSWNKFSLKCYRNNFCPKPARMTADMEYLMSFGSQVMPQQVTYVVYMLDSHIFSVAGNFCYFGKNCCVFSSF